MVKQGDMRIASYQCKQLQSVTDCMSVHASVQMGYVVQAAQSLLAFDGINMTAEELHDSTIGVQADRHAAC